MMNLESKIISLRRHFHKNPELSFNEYNTQRYIVEIFQKLNCVIHLVSTGVLVYFENHKENTIAFRCEEDALNIKETSNVAYKSTNNFSHSCGHDGHMGIVVSLGEYINDNLKTLTNNYLLIFEHGEETIGGSKEIIKDEFYLSHLPKYVFGLHVYPFLKEGEIFLKEGYFISKATEFDIEIKGKSSHVVSKELGLDALVAGVNLINRLNIELSKMDDVRFLFGIFNSGIQRNIVSDYSIVKGTFRVFEDTSFEKVKQLMNKEKDYLVSLGFNVSMIFNENYSLYNDPSLVNKIKKLFKVSNINRLYIGESFGYYQKYSSCAYALLGVDSPPLHSTNFDFNDSLLINGFNYYKALLNIE